MKFAVTGDEGFIGRRIRKMLREAEIPYFGYDRVRGFHLDQRCPDLSGFDAVIHCAAHADISRNWESETERRMLYRDNVTALINVIEASKGCGRFVFVSSAATTVRGGIDSPYATSKIFGERMTACFFPTNSVIVRLVSCVGEGYSHGHVADFVRKMKASGHIHALDDGHAPKSFVHVDDAAECIVSCAAARHGVGIMHVAKERWSWRDTIATMAEMKGDVVPFTYEPRAAGWLGDPVGLKIESDWKCDRSVHDGVREALQSLGWPSESESVQNTRLH